MGGQNLPKDSKAREAELQKQNQANQGQSVGGEGQGQGGVGRLGGSPVSYDKSGNAVRDSHIIQYQTGRNGLQNNPNLRTDLFSSQSPVSNLNPGGIVKGKGIINPPNPPQTVGGDVFQGGLPQHDPTLKGFTTGDKYIPPKDSAVKGFSVGGSTIFSGGGGKGKPYDKDTNPFGVQFTGGQSKDYNAKATDYANSLITNVGLNPDKPETAQAFNTAFQNFLSANKLEVAKESSIFQDTTPKIKFSENYGYTNTKPTGIITKNTNINPLEANFSLDQGRVAKQARSNFSYQFAKPYDVGVSLTKAKSFFPKTKSGVYGWSDISKDQLTRGSAKEEQTKQSEADKALNIYGSFTNKDYAQGGTKEPEYNSVVTLGKAQKVFGKTATGVFGWKDVSKDQLVRGSPQEKSIAKGRIPREDFGTPFSVEGGIVDRQAGSIQAFQTGKTQTAVTVQKPEQQAQNFDTFYSNAEARGSTISVFNQQGQKIGSFKATESNKSGLDSLAGTGAYFREERTSNSFNSSQQRSFADTLGSLGSQGATINIFNSKNQKIGSVSGPNAYRDFISKFGQTNEQLIAQPVFSTTLEGKKETQDLISGARNVGATSINVFLNQKGKQPTVIESIPLNQNKVSSALDKYSGNTQISFGYTPKQIETPKDTTLIPSSITPLDLGYISSKSFTGKYFNAEQVLGGYFVEAQKQSQLPLTEKGKTTNQFGISIPNPETTIYEAGQSFGSIVLGGVKSIPPTAVGIGTSAYNLITTGSSGVPARPESPKAFANVLVGSILEPTIFMGKQASTNYQTTSDFIHAKIGTPIKEQGINLPQPVQNPKTIGTFIGNIGGGGFMFASARPLIPIRVAGEEGTIAFPGIGRVKSAGPLAKSEPYIQAPKTVTITGVTVGYGGQRSIMLFGKSSEGKTFIGSRLNPKYNPATGKENLHLETYSASAERGSPFPESTKLTIAKLANEKTSNVLQQITNEKGIPKFSKQEFGLELAAKEANKNYNKIPNQKVSEAKANEFFKQTSITESPEITLQVKKVSQETQSKTRSVKNAAFALFSGDRKLASSYGVFTSSALPEAKGSPIVAGQIGEYNALQTERSNRVSQPPAESVKDIDIEITKTKQSEALTNILNAKVERPSGYEFTQEGSNIFYGKEGEKGKEVFNLLTDKDINPTDLSPTSAGGVFGKEYPTKKASLGKFKTKTIGYQARALTNSLSATHNLELVEKTKATTEPKVYQGILGRLQKSEHIVTAFTPRLQKDLSRNVAVLEYGIKTTKGKARESFINYRNKLLEAHPYVELENITPEELSKQVTFAKSTTSNTKAGPISQSNISNLSLIGSSGRNLSVTNRFGSSYLKSPTSPKSPTSTISPSSKSISSKSSFSTKSGKSSLSPSSTKSNLSSGSSKSTYSSRSIISNISPKSPTSTISPSSKSSISPFSSSSPKSSSPASPSSSSPLSPLTTSSYPLYPSVFSNYPNQPKIFPKIKIGGNKIRRKNKTKEGPTALFNLDVNNIFASNLSIIVPKGRRYEF